MTSLPLSPWLNTLLTASLYGSLIAASLFLLLPALRPWLPAKLRFLLCLLLLARFVPLPLPESRLSLFNLLPSRQTAAAPAPRATDILPPTQSALAQPLAYTVIPKEIVISTPEISPAPAPATAPPRPIPWPFLLDTLYLLGLSLFLARLALSTFALRRLLRRAIPVNDPHPLFILTSALRTLNIRRPLPLLITPGISSPALAGLFRPALLLPPNLLDSLSPEELRLIFLHEAAHLRRHDILFNYLLTLLHALHWFNPLFLLLLPRIKAERELACDEHVLAHTQNPASYGHTLLKLFEHTAPSRKIAPSPLAVGIVENKSFFTRRIRMIASFKKSPAWLLLPALAALPIIAACTLTSATTSAAAPSSSPVPPPPGYRDYATQIRAQQPPKSTANEMERVIETYNAATTISPKSTRLTESPTSPANAATLEKLNTQLPELAVDQQPAFKVLEYLRSSSGLNLYVNQGHLAEHGVDLTTPITVSLKDIPLRKALRTALDELGRSTSLDYVIDDGVVTISDIDDLLVLAERQGVLVPPEGKVAAALKKLAAEQPAKQTSASAKARTTLSTTAATSMPQLQVQMTELRETQLLERQIQELQQQLDAKGATLGTQHPEIAAIDAQLQAAKAQLARQQKQLADARATTEKAARELDRRSYDVRRTLGVPDTQTAPLTPDQRTALKDLEAAVANIAGPSVKITSFNGTLVIYASPDRHKQIEELLSGFEHSQREREATARDINERTMRENAASPKP